MLSFLVPLAVLGLIVWAIVGATRRGGDPFTLATATALYARVALLAGVLMSLTGLGIVLKAAFGFINLAYSYNPNPLLYNGYQPCPPGAACPPPIATDFSVQQRDQDLVLGITLVAIGVLVAAGHYFLGRAVAGMQGGSPGWIVRGTLLGLTVMTAVAGIPSAAIGLYQLLSYFIVGTSPQNPQPWGEAIGLAIAFVPAWIYAMTRLVGDLRRPHIGATAV
ncbi:MAG: hypothetical protein ABI334_09510 [Candidatus Dormiibacterota bacterium]